MKTARPLLKGGGVIALFLHSPRFRLLPLRREGHLLGISELVVGGSGGSEEQELIGGCLLNSLRVKGVPLKPDLVKALVLPEPPRDGWLLAVLAPAGGEIQKAAQREASNRDDETGLVGVKKSACTLAN